MTPHEAESEGARLSGLLDQGIEALRKYVKEAAGAERDYRKQKAQMWVQAQGTAKEREAWVDAQSADLRYERDIADGMKRAAIEAIRARQQQLSLLQTLVNAYKAEANFARTGPS